MTSAATNIGLATRDDIAGILDLQDANQPDRGGTLSARFSREWMEAALLDLPVIVARRDGRIVGYLLSSSVAGQESVPIVQAMRKAYTGAPDAYIYGPICVAEDERGRGLAAALFAALRQRLPGREAFTFIRRDNAPSLQAHAKMGMREVAEFIHGGVDYVVVTYKE